MSGRRRPRWLAGLSLLAALGLVSCAAPARPAATALGSVGAVAPVPAVVPSSGVPTSAAHTAATAGSPPSLPATAPAPPAADVTSPPVLVRLPRIRVSAPIEQLHLGGDGTLTPPRSFTAVGWYADGPAPGDLGPAVLAGHVDTASGPAVFARLRDLGPGDTVQVVRADGQQLTFVVDRQERVAKNAFPTASVYAPTPLPVLRLITCAGAFDRGTGHYVDNLVVFAHLRG